MSFLSSLAGYKKKSAEAARAAANPAPVKPPYKHPMFDKLVQIREDSLNDKESHNSSVSEQSEGNGGITLMFIIIDALPFEAIWRTWIECGSLEAKKSVDVLIHAKYPDQVVSPWVRKNLCKSFQLKPEWGSIELTDVMVRLLNEAVYGNDHIPIISNNSNSSSSSDSSSSSISSNSHSSNSSSSSSSSNSSSSSHFCFVSESCLPIVPLDAALADMGVCLSADKKQQSSKSWMHYTKNATNGYAQQLQFNVLKNILPEECLYKADQWVLLTRSHAEQILLLPKRLKELGSINSGGAKHAISGRNSSDPSASSSSSSKILASSSGGVKTKTYAVDYESRAMTRSSVLQLFNKVRASDEMFIPCCLALAGVIQEKGEVITTTSVATHATVLAPEKKREIEEGKVLQRALTWCDWSEGGKSPQTYTPKDFNVKSIALASKSGCIFFRKVKLDNGNSLNEQVSFCVQWAKLVLHLPEGGATDGDLKTSETSAIITTFSKTREGKEEGEEKGEGTKERDLVAMVELMSTSLSEVNKRAVEMLSQNKRDNYRDGGKHMNSSSSQGQHSQHGSKRKRDDVSSGGFNKRQQQTNR